MGVLRELVRGEWVQWRSPVVARGYVRVAPGFRVKRTGGGGSVDLGRRVRLYEKVVIYLASPGARVIVGDRSFVNRRTEIISRTSVHIGSDCAIAWDVVITDTDYHQIAESPESAQVSIGDHVWIGARALVLKGVTIGDGAVVAAGAIVVDDVPERCLVGGVPARVLRRDISWR